MRPKPKIYTPQRDDEYPRLFFLYGSPPRELKTNNLIFSAQIIGLNLVLIYEKKTSFMKTYNQICALNSCDKRDFEKVTFNRQMN